MSGIRRPRLEAFTPGELQDLLAEGSVVLVDVREPAEFAAGHIAGAVPVPLSTFNVARLPPGRLVFYCAIGRRSAIAAESARKAGRDVAGHLGDGLTAWVGTGLPIER